MSVVFDILSLNVTGIGDSIERRQLFNYAKKHTSSSGNSQFCKKSERLWVNQWGCGREAVIFLHGSSNARGGVLIAFRESLDYKILSVTCDSNGRFIVINTIIKGSPFILINYHAPNDENGQIWGDQL